MGRYISAVFTTVVVAMAVVLFPHSVESQMDCVSKLVPCANFIGSQTKPSSECCNSIKDAVQKDLPCLCTVYTTPGTLSSFNITVDQALGLSKRCGVSTDLSVCKSIGAKAPSSLPPPPATKGSNENGSIRITGAWVCGIVLVFASWVFH